MDAQTATPPSPTSVPSGWARAGRAFLTAARATGRGVSAAYASVDPDLFRHAVALPALGLTMLTPRQKAAAALPPDGHRPLILVHGHGGARGNFHPMRWWFSRRGRTRTYAVGLDGSDDVAHQAETLRRFVAEVAAVNDLALGQQVDLVAHSMGGLVARHALRIDEVSARVATLVTLGTPHGGTHAARYAGTQKLRALRPNGEPIVRLARDLPWRGPTRLVCVGSSADLLLLPPETAFVEGAENHPLPSTTHYGFLLAPHVFRLVFDVLLES